MAKLSDEQRERFMRSLMTNEHAKSEAKPREFQVGDRVRLIPGKMPAVVRKGPAGFEQQGMTLLAFNEGAANQFHNWHRNEDIELLPPDEPAKSAPEIYNTQCARCCVNLRPCDVRAFSSQDGYAVVKLCEACYAQMRSPAPKFKSGDRVLAPIVWGMWRGTIQELNRDGRWEVRLDGYAKMYLFADSELKQANDLEPAPLPEVKRGDWCVCVCGQALLEDRCYETAAGDVVCDSCHQKEKAEPDEFEQRNDLVNAMHRANVASGGQDTKEQWTRCMRRTEEHFEMLKRYELDMRMLGTVGSEAFAKTKGDYPVYVGTFSNGSQWPELTFEKVKQAMAEINRRYPMTTIPWPSNQFGRIDTDPGRPKVKP